jgi:hypothetical protein
MDAVVQQINILRKLADDTKLGKTGVTETDRDELQEALNQLCTWADTWGMQFNVAKCTVMHMGHKNPKHVYQMNGQELEVTAEERDIGVMVADNLKPSAQCAKAARTAQSVLGQLTRAFHYRDRHIFIRLYKQYVRPHLEFSTQAWAPWTEADKSCLEKIQQRAVRMVSGLAGKTYEERSVELGLETLEERRHQVDMAMVHKITYGKGQLNHSCRFEKAADGQRATRNSADPLNLRVNHGRLEIKRNFFGVRVIESWNKIPSDLKSETKNVVFRSKYKTLRALPMQPAAARTDL